MEKAQLDEYLSVTNNLANIDLAIKQLNMDINTEGIDSTKYSQL